MKLLRHLFYLLILLLPTYAYADLYPMTNFGVATVSTGYNSAATTIIVTTGHGAKFPSSFPFYLVWFNSTDYGSPDSDPNVEIIEVTNRSSDTLTVVRGQDGTSAVNHNTVGKTYKLYLGFTKKYYDKINTDILAASSTIPNVEDCSAHASCNAAVTAIGAVNLRTLRVTSSQPVASNLVITANISTWFLGAGQMAITAATTVTFDRPDSIVADKHKAIFTGAGSAAGVTFSKPGIVYPQWWGAVCDGSTDDGPEIQSAIDSLPAAGGIVELHGGTCKSNQELSITKSDVTFRMDPGTTLNLSAIAGSGTANVHVSSTVIAGIKITGARVRVIGGRITGSATVSSKKVIGVHIHGASQTRIGGTKIDGLHAGVWLGNNAIEPTIQNVELDANEHNALCGYQPVTSSSPQVSRASLINVSSHGATVGDGLTLYSYCHDLHVIGGQYYSNADSGIDGYVGSTALSIVSANIYSNATYGIYLTYNSLSGTAANKLGYANKSTIIGNRLYSNTNTGLKAALEDYSLFSTIGGLEDFVIADNLSESNGGSGFQLGLVRSTVSGNRALNNTTGGFYLQTLKSVSLIGNQSFDNGTVATPKAQYTFWTADTTGATPPNSSLVVIEGNHSGDTRSGGSRSASYSYYLDKIETSTIANNIGTNAITADWSGVNGLTAVSFMNNRGTVSGSEVIGSAVGKHLNGSKSWDPINLATGLSDTTTVTVTGAAFGDRCTVGLSSLNTTGHWITCTVSGANTAHVILLNDSGGTVNLGSGTLSVDVWQP